MTVIPWLAIIVATVVSFLLGGLWYSPVLFGPAWKREVTLHEPSFAPQSKPGIYVVDFFLTLLSTSILSFCLAPHPGLLYGAVAGAVVGIGWVAPSIAVDLLFQGKSFKLFCITAGYHIVRFLIAGSLLGVLQ
jgi:hypothetical protein